MATVWLAMVLGAGAELALPWWGIAAAGFIAGLWGARSGWHALGAGFLGVGLIWLGTASYLHLGSGGTLSARIAEMMGLPGPMYLLLMTGAIGGLVGGLAAATGFHARPLLGRAARMVGRARGGQPTPQEQSD